MKKNILVPILVTTLAVSSVSVNLDREDGCNIVKAQEQLLTKTVDGMVIENGVLKRYEGNASEIVVPEGVVSIGEDAFKYKDFIECITLPESVAEIGSYAFFKCYNLEKVEIEGTIENIDTNAFCGCEKLATIDLSNVKKIGYNSFHGCVSLKEIALSALEYIDALAFSASGIEKATLEFVGKDNSIGEEAFLECENLTEVVIKGTVSEIGDEAFFGCKALENIQIEDSSKLNDIGSCSFDQTPWLTEQLKQSENKMLIINNILVKYQPEVFYAGEYDGTPYEELSSNERITKVNEENFTYTPPSDVKMETVTIPGNVKTIADGAFYGAYSVEKVVFDSNIKGIEIEEGAFDFTTWEKEYLDRENFLVIGGNLVKAKCNAEVIEIPNGVKKIVTGAMMVDCKTGKIPTEEISEVKEIRIPQSVKEAELVLLKRDIGESLEKVVAPKSFESSFADWPEGTWPSYIEFKDVDTSTEVKDVLEGYEDSVDSTAIPQATGTPTATEKAEPTSTVQETKQPTTTDTVKPTMQATKAPTATGKAEPTPQTTKAPTATEKAEPTPQTTGTPIPTGNVGATPIVQATETPQVPTAVPTQTQAPGDSTPTPEIKVKRAVISKAKRMSKTKIRVTMKKLETVKGYQIVAATDKKFKKNVKKVTSTRGTVTLKKLKKGKTYYIKVRAYKLDSGKKKVYGKYSAIKKIK